jgi:hypothetical protein
MLVYLKYDPEKYIVKNNNSKSFDKYHFIEEKENIYDKGKILFAGGVEPHQMNIKGTQLGQVKNSSGKNAYTLWEVNVQN